MSKRLYVIQIWILLHLGLNVCTITYQNITPRFLSIQVLCWSLDDALAVVKMGDHHVNNVVVGTKGCLVATTGYLTRLSLTGPGARSTNDLLLAIQIRWQCRFAIIQLLAIRSQQLFAHATPAQLSCHAQNFVAITLSKSWWEWNEISIEFEFRW